MLERQMGCSWTGPELASWPEKPQPTSENMPSLGKGEGGGGPSIKGVFPWGAVWPCPRPHPSLHPLLSALSPGLVLVTCLKVGSGCPPVSGQTPRHSNFHSFCIEKPGTAPIRQNQKNYHRTKLSFQNIENREGQDYWQFLRSMG